MDADLMAVSDYVRELRSKVGSQLILFPVAAAVIRDAEGRVLLQHRTDGLWGLPGGGIDPGETPAEAIVREVREETGLAIVPDRLTAVLGGRDYRHRYGNGDEVELTVLIFDCRAVGGDLRPQADETRALRYVAPTDFPPLILPFPAEIFVPRDEAGAYFQPV